MLNKKNLYVKNIDLKDKKVVVLFIITSLKRSGPVNVLYGIINKLDRSIFIPIILTIKPERKNSRVVDFEFLKVDIIQARGSFAAWLKIREINRKRKLTIIHSHGFFPDLINCMVKFSGVSNISTLHNYPFEDYLLTFGKLKGYVLALIHVWIEKRLICVACSDTVHDKILKKSGLETIVVKNGVSFDKSGEFFLKKEIMEKHLLYLGNIDSRKNVDFLIKAFLHCGDHHLILDVVGDGNQYQYLKEKYHSIDEINFFGRVKNPIVFLSKSDVFVSASISEGLPMAVLEALSNGLPVLLSNIPSHNEILNSGNFGHSFLTNNEQDFKKRLHQVIVTKYNSQKIISQAQKMYSDTAMARSYAKVYLSLST